MVGATESLSDTATVLGKGAVTVTINVPLASIRTIKVGQPATVVSDGATKAVTGAVTSISLLPTTTSASTNASTSTSTNTSSGITYPVTVLVPQAGTGFVDGSVATVSLLVKAVHGVVTVPNSAITGSVVRVLTNGKVVRTPVVTGAVGAVTTQVTSGLTVGQDVVIADLSVALPTSSTTTTFGRAGGFGRTGGVGGQPPGFGVAGGGAFGPRD